MKNLRQLCAAAVLTLALTLSASADGQVHTGAADGQIPTIVTGQIGTGVAAADGNMTTWVAGQMPTLNSVVSPVDPATQMVLTLWHSVLSLF